VREALERLDSQPALLMALRSLRRRLPGDPHFGDEMSTAGETTLAYLAHGVSVLAPQRDSLASEIGLAGLQLWQSLSEATGRGRGDLDLALLYADIVDFSSWALETGDAAAITLLGAVGTAMEVSVKGRGGRIVRRMGDGIIATFVAAQAAVDAALDLQAAVAEIEIAGYRPQIRTGVHWGRPRRLAHEYVGADVSIVGAIGDGAKPGQVLVSGAALSQLDPAFHQLRIGRRRRLRSEEAPPELQVAVVRRPGRD
jgi:adenylate cyclase